MQDETQYWILHLTSISANVLSDNIDHLNDSRFHNKHCKRQWLYHSGQKVVIKSHLSLAHTLNSLIFRQTETEPKIYLAVFLKEKESGLSTRVVCCALWFNFTIWIFAFTTCVRDCQDQWWRNWKLSGAHCVMCREARTDGPKSLFYNKSS